MTGLSTLNLIILKKALPDPSEKYFSLLVSHGGPSYNIKLCPLTPTIKMGPPYFL